MDHMYEYAGNVYHLTSRRTPDGLAVEYQGREIPVAFREVGEGMLVLDIDGRRVKVIVDGDDRMKHVFCCGEVYRFARVDVAGPQAPKAVSGDLRAPLTGRVIKVLVSEGEEVNDRTQIMIIEAMKMEHKIRAPFRGVMRGIEVSEGEMVEGGQLVARVEKVLE